MSENKDQSSASMIHVLDAKDKIIVSLKEASTTRDKSNESQIRLLSIDGEKKQDLINDLKDQTQKLNIELNNAKIKLTSFEEKSGNFDQLKQAVENYRQHISTSLKELKDLVAEELTNRDNKNETTTQQLRKNYRELENKMTQAQAQYKMALGNIFDKQKMAKTYIRKSLTNIQEALNLLDTNSTDLMIDESIYQNFSQLMNNSQEAFTELESKDKGNNTIIENIENLNLQLQVDEGLAEAFNAIGKSLTPQSSEPNQSSTMSQAPAGQASTGGATASAPTGQMSTGGAPASAPTGQMPTSGAPASAPTGQMPTSGAPASAPTGQMPTSGAPASAPMEQMSTGGATASAPMGQISAGGSTNQPFVAQPQQTYPNIGQPTPPHFGGYQQPAMNQQFSNQGSAALSPQQQSEPIITQQQDEDLIMRESPNLAPYNWNMLASTSTLLRFRKMLNSAIRAEEKENWTKALYIYNTVKIQRTVKDDALAINMLEDQIEAINRRARSSVSNNAKRDKIIEAYEKRKKSDK